MLYDPNWQVTDPLKPKFKERWRKILWDAAELLEREGWVQGCEHNSHGYCMMGALNDFQRKPMSIDVAKAKIALHKHLRQAIVLWNDADGRMKEEVLAVLRTVALT
jgi:hypothetical protein